LQCSINLNYLASKGKFTLISQGFFAHSRGGQLALILGPFPWVAQRSLFEAAPVGLVKQILESF
jgi:hypothetical protein